MRILVEGCDKTGKSTLVKFLSDNLDMPIVKFSQPKTDNPFQEYIEFFGTEKEISKGIVKNDNIICDRSWVGEQVYGPICRNKKMKKFEVKKLDLACRENLDLIIFCNTDKGLIKKKFKEDNEQFTNTKDIGRIERNFIKTLKGLKTNVISYDRRLDNAQSLLNIIDILRG